MFVFDKIKFLITVISLFKIQKCKGNEEIDSLKKRSHFSEGLVSLITIVFKIRFS